MLVRQADRHQHESRATADVIGELPLDVELLDFRFTRVVGRRDRVLDLELGGHARAIVESVSPPEDRAREIGLGLAG